MKIEYVTDVRLDRHQKFIVSVNGSNVEVIQERDYQAKHDEYRKLTFRSSSVHKDLSITLSHSHLSEAVLAIEIVKVIVENVGMNAAFNIKA